MTETTKKKLRWGVGLLALGGILSFALACGMSGTAIPECQDSADSDTCSQCCSAQGHSGHAYNSFSSPPCSCM
jgi:hypothetical protein